MRLISGGPTMKTSLLIIAAVVSLMVLSLPVSAQRTVQTEMLSMDLSGYHPGAAIDLEDGTYQDRDGNYVVVKNKRVVEGGNNIRMMKSRTGHRASPATPGNVKSGEKQQEAALLLPAVQKVRAAAERNGDDDCDVAWMKIEMKKVMVTSYQTNASGNDELPGDGAYKTDTGGYAIVRNGRIVEKGSDWRKYRPRNARGQACNSPNRVRSAPQKRQPQ